MDAKKFGELVGQRREDLKMTQQQVADLIGKTRGYVGQIERGLKMPSEEVFGQLIAMLGIPLTSIVSMSELEKLSPEMALIIELANDGLDTVNDFLSPEERIRFLKAEQKKEARLDEIMHALSQVEVEAGPAGWSRLNKKDRKLVQEIVNRLLKSSYYEGER